MDNYSEHFNPYKAGKPLTSDDGFFGRDDIIEKVRMILDGRQNNTVVLHGQRRIGKTSILHKLERSLPNPPFFVINFDLLDKARKPISEVLYDIANECAKKAGFEFISRDAFISKPDAFQEVFLPLLYKNIDMGQRLVLLFDEFDVLDQTQEKLPDTAAANAFHPYIRELRDKHQDICFVFVVGRRMEELGYEFLSTFKSSFDILVFTLEEQDAIALIKRGETEGAIFEQDAISEILFITRGHPYFIQLLCQEVFNRNLPNQENGKLIVTLQMVKDALPIAIKNGASAFLWIWNGLPAAERIIFSVIAEGTQAGQVLTENDIAKILRDAGIKMLVRELKIAPLNLVEWKMLEKIGEGYRFYFEIIRRWVENNKKLEKVREELEKLSPLAEMLYEAANKYFMDNNYDSSLLRLQDAIDSNPNHLKARMLKGAILFERKEYELAISELKQAYKLDEKEAFHPLVKVMLDYGELLEVTGKNEEAETIYDEIIQDIYENEETAIERKSNIVIKRGDAYKLNGEVVLAYQSYMSAGATKKASKLIVELEEDASKCESENSWNEARDIYSKLIFMQPDTAKWRSKQNMIYEWIKIEEDAKQEIILATNLYNEGDFKTSIELLSEAENKLEHIHSDIKGTKPYFLLAHVSDLTEKFKKSKENIDYAYKEYSLGNLAKVENLLTRELSENPTNPLAQELIKKTKTIKDGIRAANQEYNKGEFESAQKTIETVLIIDPLFEEARELHQKINDSKLDFTRAETAYRRKDFIGAKEYLSKLLRSQPLNPKAKKMMLEIEKDLNRLQVQNRRLLPTAIIVAIISIFGTLSVVIVTLVSVPSIAEFFLPQPTSSLTSTNPSQSTDLAISTLEIPFTEAPTFTPTTLDQLFDSNRFISLSLADTRLFDGTPVSAKIATENLQLTPGYHILKGIPLEFKYEIFTQNEGSPESPDTLFIPASAQNPLAAYFLIQADWGYIRYSGKQIGKLLINFDDGQIYEYPLVMGVNIRDWKRGAAPEAVTTISSEDIVLEWIGTAPGGTEGGMDLLKVSIPQEFQSRKINSIEIVDTSLETTGEINGGIRILAASIEIQDSSQGAWEYQVEQIPASGTSLEWFLHANEVLILTGGSYKYQSNVCSGNGFKICVLVIKATRDSTVIIENLVSKNNWLAMSTTVTPEEAIASVQDEFWISPNCGSGCSSAMAEIFTNDVYINFFEIQNPNP